MSFVLLTALVVAVQCAEVTHPPSSVNVSLNSTVTFTCGGIGDLIGFRVDNILATEPNITNRGFTLTTPVSNATDRIITVSLVLAIASEANNNANITCTVITTSPSLQQDTSPPAVLMIQGILDGVGDLNATILAGGFCVSLIWTPPYSLDNVPITGYNIITGDGDDITVNTPYHILTSRDPDPCNITTVSVGAINDVGTSQYNNVSFHYQKAPPQNDGIVSITNGSCDGITVVVDLSSLCVGERPNSITINVTHFNDTVYTTDISMILNDQLTIHHMITLQNDWIEYFIVNVTLSNRGGETSYPFPLGNLGPVNNITSSSTNCSIINVSWSRSPSVHDRVNIHNYTLRRYNDNGLVSSVTVNGNTTSYEFADEELFSHEYTYEVCGNNELGEGNCSNGTFSYLRVPTSVRDDATLTLQNNIIYYNIPIIFECFQVLPVNATISIQCDGAKEYRISRTIDSLSHNISDNIPILSSSQNVSCQLNVTLTNTNGGISTSYNKVLQLMKPSTLPTNDTRHVGGIIGGISSSVCLCMTIGICMAISICIYYKRRNKSDGCVVVNAGQSNSKINDLEKVESSIPKDDKQHGVTETTDTIESNIVTVRNKIPIDVLQYDSDSHHNNASVKKPAVVPGVIYESVQVAKERPIAPPSAVDPVIYSDIDHMRQAPPHPHANRPMSTVTVLPSGVSEDTPPAIPAKRWQDKPSSSDDTPLLPGQVNNNNTCTTTATDDNTTTSGGPTLETYL